MKPETYIRASEIGSYLYCKRAWHLAQHGAPSLNEAERARGTEFHQRHGRRTRAAGRAALLAHACAAAALALLALWLWTVAR